MTCAAALGLLPPASGKPPAGVLLDNIPVHGEQLRQGDHRHHHAEPA